MGSLTHFDGQGQAHMVDVGAKAATHRVAVATGRIGMQPATLALIQSGSAKKGDVLGVARIAGIQGAKKTSELIPLCHPIALTRLAVEFKVDAKANVAYLLGDKSPEQVAADKLWGVDYSFKIFEKNESWIKEAKQKKLTVNVWTVNEKSLMERYIDQKVDYITTDEPELLLEITKSK